MKSINKGMGKNARAFCLGPTQLIPVLSENGIREEDKKNRKGKKKGKKTEKKEEDRRGKSKGKTRKRERKKKRKKDNNWKK